jgi:hypothetical protein
MNSSSSQSDLQPGKRLRQQSGATEGADGEKNNHNIVINELLCYATKKYHQRGNIDLQRILYDFYQVDTVTQAKNKLSDDIDALSIPDWPKPPRRRLNSSENIGAKLRIDIDDIVNMLDYVDRNQLGNRLPKYVAADPDMLPSAKLTEGDLQCLLLRIHDMSNKIDELRESTNDTNRSVADIVAGAVAATAAANAAAASSSSVRQPQASHLHTAAPRQQPPALSADSAFVHADATDGATSNDDWDTDPAVQVVQRRKSNYRPKNARSTSGPGSTSYAAALDRPAANPSGTNQQTSNRPSQARRTVLGTATNSSLKAAKNLLIKKAVFKISNIDAVYTAENLLDHLTSMGVRVADDSRSNGKSCFELKPGVKQPANNKCFRVCIFAADKQKLLVKDKWASGILIQEWIFRPEDPAENIPPKNGSVPPRSPVLTDSNDAVDQQSVQ